MGIDSRLGKWNWEMIPVTTKRRLQHVVGALCSRYCHLVSVIHRCPHAKQFCVILYFHVSIVQSCYNTYPHWRHWDSGTLGVNNMWVQEMVEMAINADFFNFIFGHHSKKRETGNFPGIKSGNSGRDSGNGEIHYLKMTTMYLAQNLYSITIHYV